jgi:hypothetical protein
MQQWASMDMKRKEKGSGIRRSSTKKKEVGRAGRKSQQSKKDGSNATEQL